MKSYSLSIQTKATEQYFPVMLFIILYKVLLTLESVRGVATRTHGRTCVLKKSKNAAKRKKSDY